MSGASSAPEPQFYTKEVSGRDTCRYCGVTVGSNHYRVDQSLACASCAEKARLEGPQSLHAAFVRSVIFGVVAAIAGLIIYATFEIVTGWIIGYVALLVGFMVGKAMMVGSGGYGGRRFQIVAALLTYAAVSMAAIPVAISYSAKHSHPVQQQASPNSSVSPSEGSSEDGTAAGGAAAKPKMSFGKAIGALAMVGLASPFLELSDPFHGVIGLIILFVGIRIAWQTAAGRHVPVISGPY